MKATNATINYKLNKDWQVKQLKKRTEKHFYMTSNSKCPEVSEEIPNTVKKERKKKVRHPQKGSDTAT